MAPFGYSVWVWLKANPRAQWLLGIGAAWVTFRLWLFSRDRRVKRTIEAEIEIEAQGKSRQIIQQAEEKTDETIRKTTQARADIPRGAPSGELPDKIQSVLFDD